MAWPLPSRILNTFRSVVRIYKIRVIKGALDGLNNYNYMLFSIASLQSSSAPLKRTIYAFNLEHDVSVIYHSTLMFAPLGGENINFVYNCSA